MYPPLLPVTLTVLGDTLQGTLLLCSPISPNLKSVVTEKNLGRSVNRAVEGVKTALFCNKVRITVLNIPCVFCTGRRRFDS